MNVKSLIRYFNSVPKDTELTFMSLTKYIGVAPNNGKGYMETLEDYGVVMLLRVDRDRSKDHKNRYTEVYVETELGKGLRPLMIQMGEQTK